MYQLSAFGVIMKKIFLLFLTIFFYINTSAQNFWYHTNGPYGQGYITAINASSNGNVYVALEDIGLYRSTDSGNSFSYVNGELSNTKIRSILVNQLGYIFIGFVTFPNRGLSRSTDNGITWIQELPTEWVRVMTYDSDGYIYAGTGESGIFRSSDNGDTWMQIVTESTFTTVLSLKSSPTGYLFSSGYKNGISNDRVLRSSDNGVTWDSLTHPLDIFITNFAFSPNGNLVASFQPIPPADSSGILLSTDNGNTWSRKNFGEGAFYLDHLPLLFDEPSNSFYAVEPYWDIFKSNDYGNTWSLVSHINYNQPDIFCFDSNQEDRLFVGSVDGLKYSSDFGYNWIQSDSGIYATNLNNLTLLPYDRLYVGTYRGTFKLAEDKVNWIKDSSLVGSFITSNNGDYFLSNRKIYKSTDNGNAWSTVFEPALSFSATSELTQTTNGYIFSGGWEYGGVHGTGVSMIWRSVNNGVTWEAVYSNFGDKLIYTVVKSEEDILIAGGNDGQIIRSTDLGETWSSSNNGVPSDASIVVIRVGTNGTIFAGTDNYGIFRSTNAGVSWSTANNGLNSVNIKSISINSVGRVFAGTPDGVFVSNDNGDHWNSINIGLLDVSILSLLCDSLDYLYAATVATGVYRSMYPTTPVENEFDKTPSNYSLSQNYPNPFNPITTITFQFPEMEFVTLKVYDVLGREVATLVNGEKPAGSYAIEFNGTRFTSGIYFYQLKAGDYTETKKMILIK